MSPYRAHEEVRHTSMETLAHQAKVAFESCPSCGGAFFDKSDLVKVEKHAGERKRAVDRSVGVFERSLKVAKSRLNHVSPTCPRCKEEMFEREWRMGTMVMIDICITCEGVWLDAGELESLEEFFAGGS